MKKLVLEKIEKIKRLTTDANLPYSAISVDSLIDIE